MNYDWVNGVVASCFCGRPGTWGWEDGKFVVWHGQDDECRTVGVTKRQEQALRRAKGKKRPY